MTIYMVMATIYDYWFECDRDGYVHEVKYFTTREKAEAWVEENKNFCYGYDSNEAKKAYEKPTFKIEEVEVL